MKPFYETDLPEKENNQELVSFLYTFLYICARPRIYKIIIFFNISAKGHLKKLL